MKSGEQNRFIHTCSVVLLLTHALIFDDTDPQVQSNLSVNNTESWTVFFFFYRYTFFFIIIIISRATRYAAIIFPLPKNTRAPARFFEMRRQSRLPNVCHCPWKVLVHRDEQCLFEKIKQLCCTLATE